MKYTFTHCRARARACVSSISPQRRVGWLKKVFKPVIVSGDFRRLCVGPVKKSSLVPRCALTFTPQDSRLFTVNEIVFVYVLNR